jgi:hypothetical protein
MSSPRQIVDHSFGARMATNPINKAGRVMNDEYGKNEKEERKKGGDEQVLVAREQQDFNFIEEFREEVDRGLRSFSPEVVADFSLALDPVGRVTLGMQRLLHIRPRQVRRDVRQVRRPR